MAYCRVCTADIRWGTIEGTDTKVPIDEHEEMDSGPDRYRVLVEGTHPTLEAIDENSPIRAYVDHRTICRQPRVV